MTAFGKTIPAGSEAPEPSKPLIEFEDVTLRIRDRHILPATHWRIGRHENWAVLGPNGSGKSTLMSALSGETPVVGGRIRRYGPAAQPDAIGLVSFERHQQVIAGEEIREEARCFSGNSDACMTVEQFIGDIRSRAFGQRRPALEILEALDLERLMPLPVQKLSNGEMRKILILKAAVKSRELLVLDEPFAGLDIKSRELLKESLENLVRAGLQLILATHRYENIVATISHIIFLNAGKVVCQGKRERMMSRRYIRRAFGGSSVTPTTSVERPKSNRTRREKAPAVIDVRHVSVRYGGRTVFADLSWKVEPDENWAVIGPNGCGKTTLLQLITADHPQAYANEIYLFGRRRGSGESIWEIKQHIGMMSSEFQVNYRKPIRSFEVVLSGFFDSIGLYRRASDEQRKIARGWIARVKLSNLMNRRYDLLSYGEKRLVLLARAMVKSPAILVLDEPCQGLDVFNRRHILSLIEDICLDRGTQLIYVTHHMDEMPACISHVLDLALKTAGRVSQRPHNIPYRAFRFQREPV